MRITSGNQEGAELILEVDNEALLGLFEESDPDFLQKILRTMLVTFVASSVSEDALSLLELVLNFQQTQLLEVFKDLVQLQ